MAAARPPRPLTAGEAGEREAADRGTRLLLGALRLWRDGEQLERVDRIGQRLAAHSQRPDLPWTFEVLDSNALDAVAVGLGRVYVTRGLVALLDDEELAGALSHAVSHTSLRHTMKADPSVDAARRWQRKANEARERLLKARSNPLDAESQKQVEAARRDLEECTRMAQQSTVRKEGDDRSWDAEYDVDRCAARCLVAAGWPARALLGCLAKMRAQHMVGQTALMYAVCPHPVLDERIKIAERAYQAETR